jgi:hypothetical protein
MSDKDPLVSRIDALVKRRRSFVATEASAPAPRREEEDVPLLTEVIDLSEGGGEAPIPLEPLIQALAADLAHALEYRLQTDLPGLLDAAFDRLASDLRSGIAGVAESAVRDFLGRQQQLRLPFPTPDAEE